MEPRWRLGERDARWCGARAPDRLRHGASCGDAGEAAGPLAAGCSMEVADPVQGHPDPVGGRDARADGFGGLVDGFNGPH